MRLKEASLEAAEKRFEVKVKKLELEKAKWAAEKAQWSAEKAGWCLERVEMESKLADLNREKAHLELKLFEFSSSAEPAALQVRTPAGKSVHIT